MQTLTISKLAQRAGVGVDTVRYYEREGLLLAPPRRASGYRDYPLDAVARLRFIRRAKALGFTLEEISELMALSMRRDVTAVKAKATSRLESVEHKIAELKRVRNGLRKLIDVCPGQGSIEGCPIIAALSGKEES